MIKRFEKEWKIAVAPTMILICVTSAVVAQPPRMRRHTATQARELDPVAATRNAGFENRVAIEERGEFRIITVNGVPEHKVGAFPNRGNPHSIAQRPATYRVPLKPQQNRTPVPVELHGNFGVAVNGVLFDPGAAEFWVGNPRSGWQYEALGGAVPLGLDANYAHVQPDGKYHYHGLPTGLMKTLNFSREGHSPLIGWAGRWVSDLRADGF